MRIVVLGGAGKMGCISVQSLTKDPRVDEVVIADYNLEQAKVVAETIDSAKISIEKVDVNDHAGLVKHVRNPDPVTNTFPLAGEKSPGIRSSTDRLAGCLPP